jgi:hypothetical protein
MITKYPDYFKLKNCPNFSAYTDRFTFKTNRNNSMEYYRIIILPWPEYRKSSGSDQDLRQGADLIEGNSCWNLDCTLFNLNQLNFH